MKSTTLTKWVIAAIAVFGTAGLMAQEQTQQEQPQQAQTQTQTPEQTGHGVARISLIHGDVSTQRGDSGDTVAATLNAPVVAGDKISTGENSRAEVQLDFANILRLSDRSQANVANLTDKDIQVQVSQGSASYTAFKTSEIRPEVDTANLSVRPSKGDVSFRVVVVSPDETEVTVRNGEVEVSTSSGSTQAHKGQMIVVRGASGDAQYKVEDARNRDDWDKWNDDRDRIIHTAEGVNRTSPYYTGAQDLDAYGHWTTVPEYGSVWVPSVSGDWAPYREGRWVWEPYYGWTWVSSEAWGWAPYHYGRWFYWGASWVWWPGPVGFGYGHGFYRPIWAPAYVSFFGFGGGVGVGFGSFGWLPIGPCDSFFPWYGGYRSRFGGVNVTNIYHFGGRGDRFRGEGPLYRGRGFQYSNLRLAETNSHIRGAISSMPAEHFGSGRVAARGIDGTSFHNGRMMTGNLPVVPTRESLNASNRAAAPGTFRGSQPGHFFGTNRGTTSAQPFERQAAQVQQDIQRDGHFTPVRGGEGAGGRNAVSAGNNPGANRAGENRSVESRGGENRGTENRGFGNQAPRNSAPEHAANAPRETPLAGRVLQGRPADNQGWQRFSGPAAGPGGNRGTAMPTDSRGSNRGQFPSRGPQANAPNNGGGWDRGQSNRGSEPFNRGNAGNDRPSNGGNGGWDRGARPESPRSSGPAYRGPGSMGDSGRGGRPTLDMRQPVVTPRSSPSPSYGPRGGGGGSAPVPRPSGGGGQSRPSGGGGHSGGGRSSGGGHHG